MADTSTPNYGFIQPEIGASRDSWGQKWNQNLGQIDSILGASTPIGMLVDFAGTNAPVGWLLADGTLHPIAQYSKLFAVLGNRFGGDGVTYFAVPDTRARVIAGVGSTTDLGGVTGGYSFGEQDGWFQITLSQGYLPNYPLSVDYEGAHTHNVGMDNQGTHWHNGSYTDWQGSHWHHVYVNTFGGGGSNGQAFAGGQQGNQDLGYYTDTEGDHYHNLTIAGDGWHAHNAWTDSQGNHTHQVWLGGSGVPLPTMQPLLALTKIIYCGPPGETRTRSLPLPSLAGLLAAPMRGMH